jgi:ParB/RepB/Spo0J family partition protein
MSIPLYIAFRGNPVNNSDIVDLASNIEELGLIYPIIVRPHPVPGSSYKWQMIAGERRAAAYRRLGRDRIPAKVRTKLKNDDKKSWATTLSENTLREQLKPNEAANAIDEGRVKYGMSRDAIAATMGLTPEAVSRLHGTNKLPEELILELDRHDKLKSRHIAAFRLLLGRTKLANMKEAKDDSEQTKKTKNNIKDLLNRIVQEDLNGDGALEQAKDILNPGRVKTPLSSFNMRLPDVLKRRPKSMSLEKRALFIKQGERLIQLLQEAVNEEKTKLKSQREINQ